MNINSMTPMQRVLTCLSHQEADRVPVYPILSGITRKLVGATYEEWATDASVCSQALLTAANMFDLDCIVTLIDLSVECDAWGQKLIFHENDAAHPDHSDLIIKEIADYEKIKKVDYHTSKRMIMHIETCKRLVLESAGIRPIVAFVFGPLGTLSMLRNQEDLYMDLYDDPDAVKRAASEINETLKDYCNALIDVGVNAIMLDTLFASASIMSKDMWLEMEGELVRELANVAHSRNCPVMIHNCGQKIYFDAQIQTMKPCAISFLYPPDDCRDFAECKEKYGDKITLIGCVPPPMVVTATDEEWERECRTQIDTFAKGGGFILATGCEYPSGADFEKAKIMVKIAMEYGKYKK